MDLYRIINQHLKVAPVLKNRRFDLLINYGDRNSWWHELITLCFETCGYQYVYLTGRGRDEDSKYLVVGEKGKGAADREMNNKIKEMMMKRAVEKIQVYFCSYNVVANYLPKSLLHIQLDSIFSPSSRHLICVLV